MSRPALILDRDGIINVERHFVHRIEDFEWLPAIFDIARMASATDLPIVVVTNQSGIGHGYYSEEEFQALTSYMRERFAAEGAPLAAVYHCPYHPNALQPRYRVANHPWRKPNPGMILAARDELNIDLTSSILIGDRCSDIKAGVAAGVGTLVLIGLERYTQTANDRVQRFAAITHAIPWLQGEIEAAARRA